MDELLVQENRNEKVSAKYVFLLIIEKNDGSKIRVPIAYADVDDVGFVTSLADVKRFIDYVKDVINMLNEFSDYYVKVSLMSVRRAGKIDRVYVPSDIIVVIKKEGIEVAVMPSRPYSFYVEVRKNKKFINSYHIEANNMMAVLTLFKTIRSL